MFQISILKKYTAYLLAVLLFSHATTVFCDDRFYVIWRDIGLPDATRLVSQYSGRTIRVTQVLSATINLASADPLSPDGIFTLFQKSLQERGLTLIRIDGNTYQMETAESNPANSFGMPNAIHRQVILQTQEIALSEPAERIPQSAQLSGKQQETLLSPTISQNDGAWLSQNRELTINQQRWD